MIFKLIYEITAIIDRVIETVLVEMDKAIEKLKNENISIDDMKNIRDDIFYIMMDFVDIPNKLSDTVGYNSDFQKEIDKIKFEFIDIISKMNSNTEKINKNSIFDIKLDLLNLKREIIFNIIGNDKEKYSSNSITNVMSYITDIESKIKKEEKLLV